MMESEMILIVDFVLGLLSGLILVKLWGHQDGK